MAKGLKKELIKMTSRCAYLRACYLAEDLKCFGFKTDCALYQESNGEEYSEHRFNQAMDKLIDKTRTKYQDSDK